MLRSLLFIAAASVLNATAAAQQPAPAQAPDPVQTVAPALPPAVNPSVCAELTPDRPATKDYLDFVKACQETYRLQAEVAQIRASTSNSMFTALVSLGPLFGALVALISAGVGYTLKSGTEKRLMLVQQENARAVRREQRISQFLGDLAGDLPAKQSFAAAGLISLIRENLETPRGDKAAQAEHHREAVMLITAMFARLRDPALKEGEVKYIADELYKVFMVAIPKRQLKLSDFNFQKVRLENAYWGRIDAPGIDVFGGSVAATSFRNANLQGAIFFRANVAGTVFKGANLKGANFTEAAGIETASFDNATQWDAATIWPAGFNPASRGLGPASA